MATLTFNINSTSLIGNKSYTLSDADVSRWISAYRKALIQRLGSSQAALTDAQVLAKWADDAVATTKDVVLQIEKSDASASLTPIGVA